ncbi:MULTISPECIES: sugar ABC transporter substrate-binding protein [unclassified Burkholderia]|uniref:sugar ABC transporter substrate-binding protein n=1 Tax=unclassified Burkholderia TaxID=2613784 RepID=UPI002AB2BF82|nr:MULTISPECIES: sugar ABC transporter substrate-binding protein [unclassified Burkholderia]
MKRITLTVATLLIGLSLAGAHADTATNRYVVGYANMLDSDVFPKTVKTAFTQASKSDPVLDVRFTDANGDINKQLDQIDTFIAQKVNAIVVVPADYQGIVPGVEKANRAGIPVIALNVQSAGGRYTFVGSRNVDAGRLQGEFMARQLPKNSKILYLQGTPGLYHSKERFDGFKQACLDKRPDVKLLSSLSGNYDRSLGMQITEDWIQRFPHFDAIVAANDQMALGALQALKASGRLKGVMISGIDGTADALREISTGEMSQTIFQDAKGQASAAYKVVETLRDGSATPPDVLVPFMSITRNNVGQYLK